MEHVYKHGTPFDKKLNDNLDHLVKRIKGNKASLLINDGGVGEGKTTLMVLEADYINAKYGLPPISLDQKDHPQLALGGEDFLEKLRLCYERKLPVIIYDEAGDFNKRGSLTRFNAMINRTFETFRSFKILVILGLPSFHVIDNDLFDKNIPRLLLHLHSRTQGTGNFKGFSLYRMMYIKEKMKKLTVKPFAYDIVNCNFRGHFKNLEPERAKALDRISTAGKMETLKKAEVKIDGLLNYIDIGQKLGRSVQWVRKAVAILKMKNHKLINHSKYFTEDQFNRIADHLDETGARR